METFLPLWRMVTPDRTFEFALLAVPETTPATLYGLYEVFDAVGRSWEELTGEPSASPRIRPRIVGRTTQPIASGLGVDIAPQEAIGRAAADVVIVTDLALSPTFRPAGQWQAEAAWLRARYRAGSIICSVCTGAVLLAEAGILDGQVATTHWAAANLIRTNYPAVKLAPQRILSSAGEGGRIVTSGGASAWAELALYLVARFCGGREAVRISKIFLLGDHTEGQLPFAGVRPTQRHDDAVIAHVQRWIADNYHRGNPVKLMVAESGLSECTFIRRFKVATGYGPMEYVHTMRVEEAKHLLETTDRPVETIAIEAGYEDPTFFRRLFKREVGITPARYRQRFSRILRLAAE